MSLVSSPDGHDLPRLINELVPGLATKRDDFVIGLGYHVGYKSRAKLEDPFKRENSSGVDQLRRFLRFLTVFGPFIDAAASAFVISKRLLRSPSFSILW